MPATVASPSSGAHADHREPQPRRRIASVAFHPPSLSFEPPSVVLNPTIRRYPRLRTYRVPALRGLVSV